MTKYWLQRIPLYSFVCCGTLPQKIAVIEKEKKNGLLAHTEHKPEASLVKGPQRRAWCISSRISEGAWNSMNVRRKHDLPNENTPHCITPSGPCNALLDLFHMSCHQCLASRSFAGQLRLLFLPQPTTLVIVPAGAKNAYDFLQFWRFEALGSVPQHSPWPGVEFPI